MSETPIIPSTPHLTDGAKRRRWLDGMTREMEASRMSLVNVPDAEGPEALDPEDRERDDLLADLVHDKCAIARRAIREALEEVKARRETA